MRTTRPGQFEYQVEAELLHEFRSRGAQSVAYGSIVAGAENACILHYRDNDARLRAGTLLLIDAGCELDGYASDITRTFPVDGHFSGPQRAIYDIVLAAQHAAIAATVPGARFIDPHDAAVRVLTQGLIDEHLVAGPVDDAIAQGTYKRFYMHRTGHWLGMDVHDVGDYRESNSPWSDPGTESSALERPWRTLQPGMVLTIEPGLYIRAADDVPVGFHDIGIRIEDDALVTSTGCEILTASVPTAADAIEALMAEGKRSRS
jgi:Xaa-Pro aminopeptidase